MQLIGVYGSERGLGGTLLAAHLYYYLREHGVRCCASSRGFRSGRPPGLARWEDIPTSPSQPFCYQTMPKLPLGMGVEVRDLHAELLAPEIPEHGCDSWVIPIRDEETLHRALAIANHLFWNVILVWNGADDALRRHVRLRWGRIQIATTALPQSELLQRADETTTPIWRLPGGARSAAGRAMIRVLREILTHCGSALDPAARVIGGQPPAPPTCGRCRPCEYHQERTASAA